MKLIVSINEVTFTDNAKGGYKTVKGVDDKGKEFKKNVFDHSKWDMLQEGATLQFDLEKEGNFWNVKDINTIEEAVKQSSTAPQSKSEPIRGATGTKTHADNRSYVLSYAKDVAVAMIASGKECTVKTTLDIADQFLAWMNKE